MSRDIEESGREFTTGDKWACTIAGIGLVAIGCVVLPKIIVATLFGIVLVAFGGLLVWGAWS